MIGFAVPMFFIVATLLGFSVPSVPMLLGFAVPMVPTLRLTSVCGVGQAWYSDKQPTQRSRTASLGQRPRSTHILVYTLQQPGFWGHKGNARAFRIACIQRSNALSHIRHIFIWKVRVQYMPFIKFIKQACVTLICLDVIRCSDVIRERGVATIMSMETSNYCRFKWKYCFTLWCTIKSNSYVGALFFLKSCLHVSDCWLTEKM